MPVLGHVVLTEVGATAEASHSGRTLSGLPERLQASEIQIADGFYLVALTDEEYEPIMLFLNHSCEPNVGFAGNSVLVAMCDVAPGEELTTDYASFTTGSTSTCGDRTRSSVHRPAATSGYERTKLRSRSPRD